tara:strand:- start:68 stop:493 length:426 start_codon:yes stop_codon:yes gene_type:complete
MIPISSIATIDDLIVALHRLGYKKEYAEWKNGEILDKTPEKRRYFVVWKVNHMDMVRVFIHYTNPPIDDVYQVGDVFLTAEIRGEFYPYIKQWYIEEVCGGTSEEISWEDAEFIDLERVDEYLNKTIKEWERRWRDARRNR